MLRPLRFVGFFFQWISFKVLLVFSFPHRSISLQLAIWPRHTGTQNTHTCIPMISMLPIPKLREAPALTQTHSMRIFCAHKLKSCMWSDVCVCVLELYGSRRSSNFGFFPSTDPNVYLSSDRLYRSKMHPSKNRNECILSLSKLLNDFFSFTHSLFSSIAQWLELHL